MKTNIIKTNKIHSIVKRNKVQITPEAIVELDRLINHKMEELFESINQITPPIKRIDVVTLRLLFPDKKETNGGNGDKCKRCAKIKSIWLDLARQIQDYTIDEAKIALIALEQGGKYLK